MSDDELDRTGPTRRRVVRGGVALGVALLGAGFLRPFGLLEEDQDGGGGEERPPDATPTPGGERSLDLRIATVVDPPTTPPGTGGRDPRTVFQPGADDRATEEPTPASDGDDGDGSAPAGGGQTSTPDPARPEPTAVLTASAPVTLADVVPGTSGRVTTTATLTGDPADLWLAAAGADDGEGGVVEPEAAAGDDGPAGELAAALRVRLAVGGTTLYEGSLAALDVPGALVAGCATGDVPLVLAWTLPGTVGNEVQTDAASVAVTLAATDCGAPNPFAA
jgi:hypothetical protein